MARKLKKRDIKEAEIQKHNPTLFAKVKSGDLTLQEAYNIMMSEVMNVKEMKGKGTKSNKILFEEEVEIIQKRYKPTLEDWIEELKTLFPFTHQKHLK